MADNECPECHRIDSAHKMATCWYCSSCGATWQRVLLDDSACSNGPVTVVWPKPERREATDA